MTWAEPALECQDCGSVLVGFDPQLAARVAQDPYAFVLYCPPCARDRQRELEASDG